MNKKKFNPYWLIAFMLIGIVGGLIYFGIINNKVGGIFLIVMGILFYIFKIGENKNG